MLKVVKYSFIVPAYNAEKVLNRCVESIVSDIYASKLSAEVIIVENGSTDDTYSTAMLLQEKMSVIRVFRSNKGASIARNVGLKEAMGQKIIFVDADDTWLNGSLLIVEKKQNANLHIFSYKKDRDYIIHSVESDNIDVLKSWLISIPTLRMQVWAKVFDGELIRSRRLQFDETISFSEDGDFLIRYLKYCRSIYVHKDVIYNYLSDTESTMRSFNEERINNFIYSVYRTKGHLDNENICLNKAFSQYVLINMNIVLVHNVFDCTIKVGMMERMKQFKKLRELKIVDRAIKEMRFIDCLTMQLLPEAFIKCHLSLAGGVICYVKSLLNKWRNKQIAAHIDYRSYIRS